MINGTQDIISEADFRLISDMVYQHCGINLHDGKQELVQARIAKRLRSGGFATLQDYLDHIEADTGGQEFTALIDAMSTNLTSFFREIGHFNYLRQQFLPDWMAHKNKLNNPSLRAWSAGCSTGEEPYSLAMTLLEQAHSQHWDIKILATDISTRVLHTAKSGLYSYDRVDGVPEPYRSRYFAPCGQSRAQSFHVVPEARLLVSFRYLNLMNDWPFTGPFDFIFCRNVMIYFDKPTQQRLVNRFWDHLSDGGLLFTGHSESLTGLDHSFSYVQPTIYRKP